MTRKIKSLESRKAEQDEQPDKLRLLAHVSVAVMKGQMLDSAGTVFDLVRVATEPDADFRMRIFAELDR